MPLYPLEMVFSIDLTVCQWDQRHQQVHKRSQKYCKFKKLKRCTMLMDRKVLLNLHIRGEKEWEIRTFSPQRGKHREEHRALQVYLNDNLRKMEAMLAEGHRPNKRHRTTNSSRLWRRLNNSNWVLKLHHRSRGLKAQGKYRKCSYSWQGASIVLLDHRRLDMNRSWAMRIGLEKYQLRFLDNLELEKIVASIIILAFEDTFLHNLQLIHSIHLLNQVHLDPNKL